MKAKHYLLITVVAYGLVGCSGDDIEDAVEDIETSAALSDIYDACQNENISSVDELENAINSGGNGLSKACRTAIFNVDFDQLSNNSTVSLNLDIALPTPGQEVNPFTSSNNTWFRLSNSVDTDLSDGTNILISTTQENLELSTLTVEGIDENGNLMPISSFQFTQNLAQLLSVNYIIDYSGSMLEADLQATSGYLTSWNNALNDNINSAVYHFSAEVADQMNGFSNNQQQIELALAYNPNIARGSTALYDAVGLAYNNPNPNSDFHINMIVSDGADNSSTNFTLETIQTLVVEANVYTIIIAGGLVDLTSLEGIVGDKGLIIYRYQIDEMLDMLQPLFRLGQNIYQLEIADDISGYSNVIIKDADETNLLNIDL